MGAAKAVQFDEKAADLLMALANSTPNASPRHLRVLLALYNSNLPTERIRT
jgi:hypothetical protein